MLLDIPEINAVVEKVSESLSTCYVSTTTEIRLGLLVKEFSSDMPSVKGT